MTNGSRQEAVSAMEVLDSSQYPLPRETTLVAMGSLNKVILMCIIIVVLAVVLSMAFISRLI